MSAHRTVRAVLVFRREHTMRQHQTVETSASCSTQELEFEILIKVE